MLLVGYLLTCGDVESNPGPGTGQEAGYNGRAQGKEANRRMVAGRLLVPAASGEAAMRSYCR